MIHLALLAAALRAPLASAAPRTLVKVDPRAELVETLQILSEREDAAPRIALNGLSYGEELRARFGRHRRHPAVAAYGRAIAAGASITELLHVAVRLLPEDLGAASPGLGERAIGYDTATVNALLAEMPAFAAESGFRDFFRTHEPLYRRYRKKVESEMRGHDPFSLIQEYTGLTSTAPITVFLCPFLEGITSVPNCGREACEIFSFWGPVSVAGDEPDFDYRDRLPALWHEIAHFMLDPLSQRYAGKVRALRPAAPSDVCYGSWPQCVREYVAQGLANRVLAWAQENGRLEGGRALINPQLPRLERVSEKLKEFDGRPGRYRTISEFYPTLLDAL